MLNNIGPAGLPLVGLIIYIVLAFLKSWKGKVFLKNPHNGRLREAPLGFSWTTLFFVFLPAIFRSHWVGAVIMILIGLVSLGASWFVFPFFYNRWYLKSLLQDGYLVEKTDKGVEVIQRYLGYELPMLSKE
ncbi:hypothetical protein [Yoonia sp.]|uniref:hypothetical protein n=1 Tax=Yoonia sp. TaxID=2212373 RepID=UPI0040482E5E